jgi:hypothetical protein
MKLGKTAKIHINLTPKINVYMKKVILALTVLTFTTCAVCFLQKSAGLSLMGKPVANESIEKEGLGEPSGENEENTALRAAWERQMLADPVTGEIPEGIRFKEQWFAANLPKAVAERNGGNWASRGPWNVGGRTRALAIDATNENRILAGGVSGGIWLSEDAGQTWVRRTPLSAHPGCVSVAQDIRPGKTNTWYYLSGEVVGTSASGGASFYLGDGLFKSTDNGVNWAPVSSTAGGSPQAFSTFFQTGYRVVTGRVDTTDVVYMASIGTIYRSANGGQTWTAVIGGSTSSYSYYTDVTISPSGVLYATLSSDGPKKGIWRSTNGTTWTNITPANFPSTYDRIVAGINPDNENEVYFIGSTPNAGHYNYYALNDDWSSLWKYTYQSGNGSGTGGTWEDRSANLPNTGTQFDKFSCQGGYDLVVKMQPGTNNLFIGGTSLYRSTDAFTTPNNTTQIGGYKIGTDLPFFELYPNHHPDQHDALFLPSNPKVMLSVSDGGIKRTEDCLAPNVVWTSLNRGYQTAQFYTAIFEKATAGDNTLIGGLQDNGNFIVNSTDPAASWKQTVNGDGAYGAIPDGKPYYILSIQQGKVSKCAIDAQGNITARRRIDPIGPNKNDYLFVNPLALDPVSQNKLYLPAGRRLFRQDDLNAIAINGQWDTIAQGWTQYPDLIADTTSVISAIAVSNANPAHRLYFGTSKGKLYKIDNADTGTPGFTSITPPINSTTPYVNCIAVDPDNADDIFVVYSNYSLYSIFRSQNGGTSWAKVAGNLESILSGAGTGPSVRWLSILPFPDGSRRYFCGTSVGLYEADTIIVHSSSNPGTQWIQQAPDLIGTTVVPFVDVRRADGLAVAATHGLGMFSANFLSPTGISEPAAGVQIRVSPNPVRDICTVYIPDKATEKIDLQLFDQQGRVVRSIQWTGASGQIDMSGLPAGAYIYNLQGKGWKKAGKVLKTN